MLHWLCVQVFADPPCGTASGSYRPQCARPLSPADLPSPRLNLCTPLPPVRHQAGGVFLSVYEILMLFMKIMRFDLPSPVVCGAISGAFGAYLCVYREEDDHTAPDRKSSGWMILSAMWLRRTVSPSRRVGRGRQILSFPSSLAVRVKKCVAADGHFLTTHFLYAHFFLYWLYIYLPVFWRARAPRRTAFTLACRHRSLTASSCSFLFCLLLSSFLPQVRRSPALPSISVSSPSSSLICSSSSLYG